MLYYIMKPIDYKASFIKIYTSYTYIHDKLENRASELMLLEFILYVRQEV